MVAYNPGIPMAANPGYPPGGAPALDGGGFLPKFLPDCELWLDAADTGTITASGANVSQWDDKSGNGNNATEGTESLQPDTGVATRNGHNVITVATSNNMDLPSALFSLPNGPNTIFFVAKLEEEEADTKRLITGTVSGASNFLFQYRATANSLAFASGTTGGTVLNSGNANTSYQIMYGRRSGTTVALAVDGGAETTDTDGGDEANIDTLTLFSRDSAFNFFGGECGEIIWYSRSLSTVELTMVKSYLSNKWNITL